MESMDNSQIEFRQVVKEYKTGATVVRAADDVNFSIDQGELVVILGASGAGKTTVLNLLGGMDRVTSGSILVDGADITAFNDRRLTEYRRRDVGFVFQFYNLITNLTALENVEFAADVCRDHLDTRETLQRVGLGERLRNFPAQLSGGEQQRVAIARAAAKNPLLLLCDEPTGALDYVTGKAVLGLLADINREYQKTVVIVTHNTALAALADRVIHIKSGRVEGVEQNAGKKAVEEVEW
jgi:putative ABC transport system ATP-binding protein